MTRKVIVGAACVSLFLTMERAVVSAVPVDNFHVENVDGIVDGVGLAEFSEEQVSAGNRWTCAMTLWCHASHMPLNQVNRLRARPEEILNSDTGVIADVGAFVEDAGENVGTVPNEVHLRGGRDSNQEATTDVVADVSKVEQIMKKTQSDDFKRVSVNPQLQDWRYNIKHIFWLILVTIISY